MGLFFFEPLAVVVDLFFKGGRAELGDGLLRLEVLVFLDEKFFDKAGERRKDGPFFFGGWTDHGREAKAEVTPAKRNPINP